MRRVVAHGLLGMVGEAARELLRSARAGLVLVLLHLGCYRLSIKRNAVLLGELLGELDRKTVGGEKGVRSLWRECLFLNELLQLAHALRERLSELLLLLRELLTDHIGMREHVRVVLRVRLAVSLSDVGEYGILDAKAVRFADRAADEAAEHVPGFGVRGLDVFREHEGGRAHVIENDAEGARRYVIRAVSDSRPCLKHGTSGVEHVDLEHVGLAHGGRDDALEAAAEVHILLRKLREAAVLVLHELHEHGVRDLDEPAAVAVHMAVRAPRRVVRRAEIVEDLGIRASWLPRRLLGRRSGPAPPVLVAVREDALSLFHAALVPGFLGADGRESRIDALFLKQLLPERDSLVILRDAGRRVAREYRHVEPVRIEPEALLRIREELKYPRQLLLLEIVAEGPVAEHLEEGGVTVVAHLLDISGAEGELRIGHAGACRMRLPEKVRHEGLHAGRGEEGGRVVPRDDGRGRDNRVPALLVEREESAAYVSKLHNGMTIPQRLY